MKFKLRRSDIILILGFWLIGLALLGIVFYLAWQQRTPATPIQNLYFVPQATHTMVHIGQTAKTEMQAALVKAQAWHEDAQLVSVTSSWNQVTLHELGQPSRWRYRFYSPSQKRFFFVTVNPDQSLFGLSHAERLRNAAPPEPIVVWELDSLTALNIWVNHGGAIMLNHLSDLQVVAQLQDQNEDNPLTWTVAGYEPTTKHYHTVVVDALTGEILDVKSSLR